MRPDDSLADGCGRPAVVLVSGGLDSATVLALAVARAYRCFALSFDYGQRHRAELEAAGRVARALGADQHRVLALPIGELGASALTDETIAVPQAGGAGIPATYVPARNTIFLAWALAWAEVLDARDIFIGVNALDYSGYPDCRPEYIESFSTMARYATRAGVEGGSPLTIRTPLIDLTKAEIIARGTAMGVDYAKTVSCYDPTGTGEACGYCDRSEEHTSELQSH